MLDSQRDNELVKRAQQGDITAIGALYDRHQMHIFRFVWSRVGNQQLAEDLTGETFTRMVSGLSGYKINETPFRAWLYRIARNLVTDEFRKRQGKTAVPLQDVETMISFETNPDIVAENNLTLATVQEALAALDPTQREVVELRFLAGYSLQEVAETLDYSVAAVKSHQHRGLKALRAALQ
ncbi:MAG: sigma-70 family RNA polymerase sigma factor [Anaerolineae bacterium]|nr:sigma-70 family RNA polymerase sigma factor [Anaerolineae bacterium]